MEVVGGVASIITLIEATGVLAEVSKNVVLRWRNAPHEIQALATRLSLLAAELQSIKNATARSHPVLTDPIIRQSLSDLLTDVRKRLAKLETLHFRLEQRGPTRQKIQWTLKDAGSAEKMLIKTQEVEQRLANLMTLISFRAQTPILDGLDRIEQMVSTLVVALPAAAPILPAITPASSAIASGMPLIDSRITHRRTLLSSRILGKDRGPWGSRASLSTSRTGLHTDYDINFSISLPLARILGSYALTGSLSLRYTSLRQNAITLRHPSYFAIARTLEFHHPFMTACLRGDTLTTRSMLQSGEGRLTDVTEYGWTPLYLAVRSGNTEVIATLLDWGVDLDVTTSTWKSTALIDASRDQDLDTVRFLLQRGASADLLNYAGYSAADRCWFQRDNRPKGNSSMDVFKLLRADTSIDVDASWTLVGAAVDACDSQIHALVRLGADVHFLHGRSAAISVAVYHGNYSAYIALASYHDGDILKRLGLELLVAAMEGRARRFIHFPQQGDTSWPGRPYEYRKIIMDILQRGVDLTLRVKSFRGDLPSDLQGQLITLDELAAGFGPGTEAWYLSVLRSCNLLGNHNQIQRVRELSEAGHCSTVFLNECEEGTDEPKLHISGGSNAESEDINALDEGVDTINEPDSYQCFSSATTSEADELEQFWDAEEIF